MTSSLSVFGSDKGMVFSAQPGGLMGDFHSSHGIVILSVKNHQHPIKSKDRDPEVYQCPTGSLIVFKPTRTIVQGTLYHLDGHIRLFHVCFHAFAEV